MLLRGAMFGFLSKLLLVAHSRLKSRARLEAENIVLRQQVIVLSRKSLARLRLWNTDRLLFVWLYRLYPSILDAITIVKPETVIRWHHRGFRAYWRWKSRRRGGRPRINRLSSYVDYYQRTRTHLSLDKDCPDSRPIMPRRIGKVIAIPQVGGLHHRYERLAA